MLLDGTLQLLHALALELLPLFLIAGVRRDAVEHEIRRNRQRDLHRIGIE